MRTKMNRAMSGQRKTLLAHDGQRKLSLTKLKDSNLIGWSVMKILVPKYQPVVLK